MASVAPFLLLLASLAMTHAQGPPTTKSGEEVATTTQDPTTGDPSQNDTAVTNSENLNSTDIDEIVTDTINDNATSATMSPEAVTSPPEAVTTAPPSSTSDNSTEGLTSGSDNSTGDGSETEDGSVTVAPGNGTDTVTDPLDSTTESPETTDDLNSTTPIVVGDNSTTEDPKDSKIEIQTQIYIVSAVFGGIILLLILLVLALALSLARLKDEVNRRQQRYIQESPKSTENIHAYDNSAFNERQEMQERRGDARTEVEKLGYSVYNGKNNENSQYGPLSSAKQDYEMSRL